MQLDIVKYTIWVQFFCYGRPGGAGPPNVILGTPNILETTKARKLKVK